MRVLVVEDERELAGKLVGALGAAGLVADVAHDGAAAERLGRVEPYDAVVLDLGLPRLDGLSVLQAWRARGRGATGRRAGRGRAPSSGARGTSRAASRRPYPPAATVAERRSRQATGAGRRAAQPPGDGRGRPQSRSDGATRTR